MTKLHPNDGRISVSGLDAKKLLQGQLTCDIEKVHSTPQLAAHCQRDGRVLALFNIWQESPNCFILRMRFDMVQATLNALNKYAIFYQVCLEDTSVYTDQAELDEHHYNNLIRNIPTIYPATSGKFLPHELNLDKLGAIHFEKGCYTGQEIIARMHYRGKLKNHLYRAKITTDTPTPGQPVNNAEGRMVGTWVDISGDQGLLVCDDKEIGVMNIAHCDGST